MFKLFLKKPGMIPGFFLFGICLVVAAKFSGAQAVTQKFQNVCHFVDGRIFLPSEKMKAWKADCLQSAKRLSNTSKVATIVATFNQSFSALQTSHLLMYAPEKARSLWNGESKATGIESHYVDGEQVVAKVHAGSPAAKAGIRFGDVLLKINGELGNPEQAESEAGQYLIRSRGQTREVQITVAEFQRDEKIEIKTLPNDTALLVIPSFRATFFEKEPWLKEIEKLKESSRLIIDLRGNLGGNFVAGLRLLSPFLCKPTVVGSLLKPKWPDGSTATLRDDLTDDSQIATVDEHQRIFLSSFEGYGCLQQFKPGAISVLVDSSSASTSEMVAQALKELKGAKIYGSTSAGQMLVGMWYPMDELSPGVKLSVPEAVYESHAGRPIEGPGVELDQVLYYRLHELEKGEDSWVKAVLKRNVSK